MGYHHSYQCRCQRCRNRNAYSADLFKGGCLLPVIVVSVLAGVIWVALVPLRIWHRTGTAGQIHPDTATWTAYGVSGGAILLVMMTASIYASMKAERTAKQKSGGGQYQGSPGHSR